MNFEMVKTKAWPEMAFFFLLFCRKVGREESKLPPHVIDFNASHRIIESLRLKTLDL